MSTTPPPRALYCSPYVTPSFSAQTKPPSPLRIFTSQEAQARQQRKTEERASVKRLLPSIPNLLTFIAAVVLLLAGNATLAKWSIQLLLACIRLIIAFLYHAGWSVPLGGVVVFTLLVSAGQFLSRWREDRAAAESEAVKQRETAAAAAQPAYASQAGMAAREPITVRPGELYDLVGDRFSVTPPPVAAAYSQPGPFGTSPYSPYQPFYSPFTHHPPVGRPPHSPFQPFYTPFSQPPSYPGAPFTNMPPSYGRQPSASAGGISSYERTLQALSQVPMPSYRDKDYAFRPSRWPAESSHGEGGGGGGVGFQQAAGRARDGESPWESTYQHVGGRAVMDQWLSKLQEWLQVWLRGYVAHLQMSDQMLTSALSKLGARLSYESLSVHYDGASGSLTDPNLVPIQSKSLPPHLLNHLEAVQLKNMWDTRQVIESFLRPPSYPADLRLYVLRRLRLFADYGFVKHYKHDYREAESYPTDSHILENVLLRLLNTYTNFLQAHVHQATGQNWRAVQPAAATAGSGQPPGMSATWGWGSGGEGAYAQTGDGSGFLTRTGLGGAGSRVLYMRQLEDQVGFPLPALRYEVVTTTRPWPLAPGNRNLFEAIALLIYFAKRHSAQLYMTLPKPLQQVVEDRETDVVDSWGMGPQIR
ncbi:unnamed protein product [Vitrella brassicaformis CCMP3155]|uniref:Uncharacterized protein n=2 Tax=Vitrella brassicaformis TaxID=1169539 RepID=A0A0G4EGU2_VITBC|nr:unnamed protein product [Vitrella brassicaformis CCMP3155]|eukprot:CEL94584.1 unnamed protein product [Vitrella brassicaformis CCMP3155]